MGVNIGRYIFEGPFSTDDSLEDRSGVYAILRPNLYGSYDVIDIGESHAVRKRLKNHDRAFCWLWYCGNAPYYAVYYTKHLEQPGRKQIEQELRKICNPPCGDR